MVLSVHQSGGLLEEAILVSGCAGIQCSVVLIRVDKLEPLT